jgi:hypothetical protein
VSAPGVAVVSSVPGGQWQNLLVGSVEELGEAGQDHRYGFGRIDVLGAIGLARDRGF